MASSFFQCQAISSTQITLTAGASVFFPIVPIKNQVGIAFSVNGLTAGLEIAGGGISYAPAGFTLVAGVTVGYNLMNANGSSIGLKANGSGYPICRDVSTWPQSGYLPGAPALWLSAGASQILNVLYFTNEAMPNQ